MIFFERRRFFKELYKSVKDINNNVDDRVKIAKKMYEQGKTTIEIANTLNVSEVAVRRWRFHPHWDDL